MSDTNTSPETNRRSTRMSNKFLSFIIDDDPIDDEYSQSSQRLYQVLSETGENAMGVIAIEVWTLRSDRTKLHMPRGGFWVDPVYLNTESSEPLLRLIDDSRSDHLPPVPLSPGVGLAGALWLEFNGTPSTNDNITWRDIKLLSIDPDQPLNYRLKALSEAGFGIAAGLPFNKNSASGIVIFMARQQTYKFDETYLHSATDLFGTMISHERETRRVDHNRDKFLKALIRRVRIKLLSVNAMRQSSMPKNSTPIDITDDKYQFVDSLRNHKQKAVTRTQMWLKKLWGAKMHPPPPLPLNKAFFVITASFIQMLILAWVSNAIGIRTQGHFKFRMGTVAAFTCMQYTLTSAPAAQPLTGLVATLLSCIVALGVRQIPFATAAWIRPAIASSLAIILMALAGVPHPPAAGTAIAFSTEDVVWRDVGILLLSYVIAIALATSINNASETRQYPIFWTNIWVERIITACRLKSKSKVETDITK